MSARKNILCGLLLLALVLPASLFADDGADHTSPTETRAEQNSDEPSADGSGEATGRQARLGQAEVKAQLEDTDVAVKIARAADGTHIFLLRRSDGSTTELSPEQFAKRVYEEQSARTWWQRLLNITSPLGIAWVALGFLGQLVFTGRMLVQWLASEREKRSVVPPVFWWLSLAGASMLMAYFLWRKDIVGVIGQTTGWMIYARNLRLIYRRDKSSPVPGSRPS